MPKKGDYRQLFQNIMQEGEVMVEIPIGEYVITSDPLCFILNEKKKVQKGKNAGKERYSPIAYFISVEECLEGLLELKIRKSDAKTLNELLTEIAEMKKFIRAQFKKARGK